MNVAALIPSLFKSDSGPPPFSPLDGNPTQFEVLPNYSAITGIWTKSAGIDLVRAGDVPAINGSPNFTQSGFGNHLDLADTLENVYGAGDHFYFCKITPSSITTTAASSSAFLNQQVWTDGFTQMGLSLKKSGSNYLATYFERSVGSDSTVKFAEVQLASQTATTVLLCKKSGGNLWIAQNDANWIAGQACGNDANVTQNIMIGGYTHNYLGRLLTEGFYNHVPDDAFLANLITWCNTVAIDPP